MEELHHELWIVHAVNEIFGPVVATLLSPLGYSFGPEETVIPDYLVMAILILIFITAIGVLLQTRLSVENPSKMQVLQF